MASEFYIARLHVESVSDHCIAFEDSKRPVNIKQSAPRTYKETPVRVQIRCALVNR